MLTRTGGRFQGQDVLTYTYARSYRNRKDAIALFTPELPLLGGTFDPTAPHQIPDSAGPASQTPNPFARVRRRSPLPMHGCLRDAAPDAWGRRIINLRLAGNPEAELDELTYLWASGSNRIGALDFQDSPTDYLPPASRQPASTSYSMLPSSSRRGPRCQPTSPLPRDTAPPSAEPGPRPFSKTGAVT